MHRVDEIIIVQAHAAQVHACCPACHTPSTRVHSRSVRKPLDLPLSEQQVQLHLYVRRFLCSTPACPRRTCTEQIPELLPPRVRRTSRLIHSLRDVAQALGGRAAARTAARLRMPVSRMTCVRLICTSPLPPVATPSVLGVDDFAFRKGRVYDTILVDLEKRRPIDLLPDRTAQTFANWLDNHPGVTTIVRDRSGEYARGASLGAPHAAQIVDRWHLLVNLRETLDRLLTRRHAELCALPVSQELQEHLTSRQQPRPLRPASVEEVERRAAKRTRRYARYEQVRALHAIGLPLSQIAQRLGMTWTTARKFAEAETFPERAVTKPRASQIDRYTPHLERRWSEGCTNASQLWREIVDAGYTGTRKQVARWAAHQRTLPASATPRTYQLRQAQLKPMNVYATTRLPSPRELVWVMLREAKRLKVAEHGILAHLQQDEEMAEAYAFGQSFQQMMRERQADKLEAWYDGCRKAQSSELRNFATSLQREEPVIGAAFREQWSTGPVEGQVTRLKSIKRQMYGRAGFELLRQRVLLAT